MQGHWKQLLKARIEYEAIDLCAVPNLSEGRAGQAGGGCGLTPPSTLHNLTLPQRYANEDEQRRTFLTLFCSSLALLPDCCVENPFIAAFV